MSKVPALLKWIGNKQRFAETIISYIPEQFNNYYEPFLGSGAVMAQLLYQNSKTNTPIFTHSYASDILPFLIDIFNIVKYDPQQIKDYYSKEIEDYYKNPNDKYNEIRDRFNINHNALDFCLLSFEECMDKAQPGDVVYCDPPYTHSQSIIYGAQTFNIETLFNKIAECKARGVYVMLSINGTRESNKKDISVTPPMGLFEREIFVNCGTSMIDRLQNAGQTMQNEIVHDKLLLTW